MPCRPNRILNRRFVCADAAHAWNHICRAAAVMLVVSASSAQAQDPKRPNVQLPLAANPCILLDEKVAPAVRLPAQSKVMLFSKAGINVTPPGLGTPVQLTPRAPSVPGVARLRHSGWFDSSLDFFLLTEGFGVDVSVKAATVGKPILVTFHVERRGPVASGQSSRVRVSSFGAPTLYAPLPTAAPAALGFVITPQSTRDFHKVTSAADHGNVRITRVETTPIL